MQYENNVFLSYSHFFAEWVQGCFLPEFEHYLREELGSSDPGIFVDRDGILAGESWPKRLKNALAKTKCLVAIWSPSYFQSEWCRKELSVMLYRESTLGYRTVERPAGLVLPVRVHDGKHFPDYATQIKWLDCEPYARNPDVLRRSLRFLEFEDKMAQWVSQVARIVNSAPVWNPDWMTDAWINTAEVFRNRPQKSTPELPTLG